MLDNYQKAGIVLIVVGAIGSAMFLSFLAGYEAGGGGAPDQFGPCELSVPEQIALFEHEQGFPGWPGEYVICASDGCFKTSRGPASEDVDL